MASDLSPGCVPWEELSEATPDKLGNEKSVIDDSSFPVYTVVLVEH